MNIYSGILSVLLIAMAIYGCDKQPGTAPERSTSASIVLIDVRSAEEFQSGHLHGAINIPHTEIADRIASAVPDKNAKLRLYCRSGRRVRIAMDALKKLDYNDLEDHGGINDAAQSLSLPIVK